MAVDCQNKRRDILGQSAEPAVGPKKKAMKSYSHIKSWKKKLKRIGLKIIHNCC